jgi:hypothetical protein
MNHPLEQPALSAFFSPVYGVYIGIIAVDRAGKVASDNTSTTFFLRRWLFRRIEYHKQVIHISIQQVIIN